MRIQDQMRAASVKRWTVVTTSRDESLAEHTFLVALLSVEIAKRAGFSIAQQHHVAMDAMMHDMAEIHTGDIPTPAKKKMTITVTDPRAEDAGYWSKETETCVKWADHIQAWWFISQWGTGRHAEEVARRNYRDLISKFESFWSEYSIASSSAVTRCDLLKWTCPIAEAAYNVFLELQHAPHEI